jgi:hypothetical protein
VVDHTVETGTVHLDAYCILEERSIVEQNRYYDTARILEQ